MGRLEIGRKRETVFRFAKNKGNGVVATVSCPNICIK